MKMNHIVLAVMTTGILGACSKLPPPVSGGLSGRGGYGIQALTVVEANSMTGETRVLVRGADAGIMYRLLGIQPETATADESTSVEKRVKVGRDFLCRSEPGKFVCEIGFLETGAVKPVREEERVLRAAPEIKQVEYSDEVLSVAPPEKPGKAVLRVVGVPAKALYDALKLEAVEVPAGAGQGPGLKKSGEAAVCVEHTDAVKPEVKSHECVIRIDLSTGTVDKAESAPVE